MAKCLNKGSICLRQFVQIVKYLEVFIICKYFLDVSKHALKENLVMWLGLVVISEKAKWDVSKY